MAGYAFSSAGRGRGSRAVVLDEDAGLLGAIEGERAERARDASVAGVLHVRPGSWDASEAAGLAYGGFGLFVLDGLFIRRVGVEGRYGAELLTRGDLLRPWQHDGEASGVTPFEMTWRVVGRSSLAVLDLTWAARMAPYPEVAGELIGRATARSQRLAMLMAIAQQPRLDQRLWLLFWELADRFGTVRPDGVHLELSLTHEVVSHLAAARRPSVSAALGRLAEQGVLRREPRGWVITGEPPVPVASDPGAAVVL
jgi:CRP/FNR family cyclic AMP-dependent transcriptional regulator